MTWDHALLFRTHAQRIRAALRRRGVEAENAADLTQEAFVRLVRSDPGRHVAIENAPGYLHRIARNLWLNQLRHERQSPFQALSSAEIEQIASAEPGPERIVAAREQIRLVELALAELPTRIRRAFILHRVEGLTIAEVGREIGLSPTRTWELVRDCYRHIFWRSGGIGP